MTFASTVVVTGASSGIGAAARAFAAQGRRVVVVGRDPGRTSEVAEETGGEPLIADFARLDDVRRLARELLALCPRIDVLANNAGGLWPGADRTVDGFGVTFQVNYLAPYLLTRLLQDRLVASSATVIATTSNAHRIGRLTAADPDRRRGFRAYADSKLATILMTREIARRWGPDVRAAAFHPGGTSTAFTREAPLLRLINASPAGRLLKSPEKAAGSLLRLASSTDWPSGGYFTNGEVAKPSAAARDETTAGDLWDHSARLVGLTRASENRS